MTLPTQHDLAKLPHLFQVRYALYAATQVAHLATLPEAATCLRVVEAYLDGKASKEDCRVATRATAYAAAVAAYADAATRAAFYAAYAAAYANAVYAAAAAYSANAAADAAYSKKTKLDLVKDLRRHYEELLNFDAISESYLLG